MRVEPRFEIRDWRGHAAPPSGPVVQRRLLQRRKQETRFFVGLGGDGRDPEHQVRRGKLGRRAKPAAIDRDRIRHHRRREMRGEREGEAEIGRQLRAEGARAEDPDRHLETGAGHRLHPLARLGGLEIAHQLDNFLREAVVTLEERPADCPGGDLVRARRPS